MGWVYTPGSLLGQTGTAVSILDNTNDIAGNLRPGEDGFYSIGAHEQQYIQTNSPPIGGVPSELYHLMPNWKYPVNTSIEFLTPISETRRKKEQRKSLYTRPKRSHSYIVTTEERHEFVFNYLLSLRSSNFYFPLFSEPCVPVGNDNLQGSVSIECLNDLQHYYSLRFLTVYLVIIDRNEIVYHEVLRLESVINNTINLTKAIQSEFYGRQSVIFPMFLSQLTNCKRKNLNDTVTNFDLEFSEVFI